MTTATEKPYMQIANAINGQLGGGRFKLMTGAKDFIGLSPDEERCASGGLMFRLPRGLAKNGINKVRIYLTHSDTYLVEALKIRKWEFDVVASVDGVYADHLCSVFTEMTGLDTHL
tara:strand:- start:5591 stop:5938 length:348 start_codon:yes stop_codon:yes gene_type:complete